MYLIENPVLQRELLVNLRTPRAFVLLLVYNLLLGLVVFFAWPREQHLDLSSRPVAAQRLVDMFFLGQYILASLMAPSFAAGAITSEKERKTYEMLLANPLRPSAILLGKLLASLCHLAILIFSSLPIVMLCLPLGGVSLYEVLAAYLAMLLSVVTFGVISIACSSYFQRTASALIASYLLILPLALLGALFWSAMSDLGPTRLWLTVTVLPAAAAVVCGTIFARVSRRLLHPPDIGSEGNEVVDYEQETKKAVGLIIQPDRWPDRLFAPPKRTDLLPDGCNPIYDKEIHSEIFSQGTLMLRLVIQISTLLSIPLMAYCLYIFPQNAPWYLAYVLLFNMLVGPVFSAGSITSERERQTLELLLTTAISPWQILTGKLRSSLRISGWLTRFLLWPLALACVMVSFFWSNLLAVLAFVVLTELSSLTTAVLGMTCSVLFRKTSTSLITSYLLIAAMYVAPVAMLSFTQLFFSENRETIDRVAWVGVVSPISAALNVPLKASAGTTPFSEAAVDTGDWRLVAAHFAVIVSLNAILLAFMAWLFNARWRVSTQ
jgi:ABC-type transport system involved in multi-copper enzyme maturation permease subunit